MYSGYPESRLRKTVGQRVWEKVRGPFLGQEGGGDIVKVGGYGGISPRKGKMIKNCIYVAKDLVVWGICCNFAGEKGNSNS